MSRLMNLFHLAMDLARHRKAAMWPGGIGMDLLGVKVIYAEVSPTGGQR